LSSMKEEKSVESQKGNAGLWMLRGWESSDNGGRGKRPHPNPSTGGRGTAAGQRKKAALNEVKGGKDGHLTHGMGGNRL